MKPVEPVVRGFRPVFFLVLSAPFFVSAFQMDGAFHDDSFTFNPPVGEKCYLEWSYEVGGEVVRRDFFESQTGDPETVPLLPDGAHSVWVEGQWGGSGDDGMIPSLGGGGEPVWIPGHWKTVMSNPSGFVRLFIGEYIPEVVINKYSEFLVYAETAVDFGVWACRIGAVGLGLYCFRIVTLRSPV